MISVIVPIYNAEKYIKKCIKSVLFQTVDFELILIDDGSTDGSLEICKSFTDKRIKVISQYNQGQSVARNKGIDMAKGKYIFFLDADDYLHKNSLKILLANKKGVDMVIGNFISVGKSKKGIEINSKLFNTKDIVDYARLYINKPNRYQLLSNSWGKLFKVSIIKDNKIYFNEKLHTFEDIDFNYEYYRYVKSIYFINKVIYYYKVCNDLTSATYTIGNDPDRLLGYITAFKKIKSYIGDVKIGYAIITLTIVQSVRVCRQTNKVYYFIKKLVNNPDIRDSLKYYYPSKGESKILPILIKLKLVRLIILVCQFKAKRRYK